MIVLKKTPKLGMDAAEMGPTRKKKVTGDRGGVWMEKEVQGR